MVQFIKRYSLGASLLLLLWLSVIGGCHCVDGVRVPPPWSEFPMPCLDHVPRHAVLCEPCYGYRPTCWRGWPECCVPCPPPDATYPIPSTGTEMLPPEADQPQPIPSAEPVPAPTAIKPTSGAMPQGNPLVFDQPGQSNINSGSALGEMPGEAVSEYSVATQYWGPAVKSSVDAPLPPDNNWP